MQDPPNESANDKDPLAMLQRRLIVIALALVIAFLALQVAQTFSDVLRILFISIFVCYMASGLVDWLDKLFKSRFAAVLTVYVVGGACAVVSVIIVIPILLVQISQFASATIDQLPHFIEWCGNVLTPLEKKLMAAHITVKPSDVLLSLAASAPKPDGSLIISQVSGVAMSTMTWLFYGLSILILTFYFLLEGAQMSHAIVGLFPSSVRPAIQSFCTDTDKSLQDFFRGQIVLGLLFGGFMVLVYYALGVPYALAVGLILGLWEIVPVIGPTIGFIPAVVAVLIQGAEHLPGDRFIQALILIIVFNVLQWLKDNIVAPKYIGNVIGLHPVVIFIAIMVGARLDGMLGIIVALPVACVINVLFKHVRHSNEARTDSDPETGTTAAMAREEQLVQAKQDLVSEEKELIAAKQELVSDEMELISAKQALMEDMREMADDAKTVEETSASDGQSEES